MIYDMRRFVHTKAMQQERAEQDSILPNWFLIALIIDSPCAGKHAVLQLISDYYMSSNQALITSMLQGPPNNWAMSMLCAIIPGIASHVQE